MFFTEHVQKKLSTFRESHRFRSAKGGRSQHISATGAARFLEDNMTTQSLYQEAVAFIKEHPGTGSSQGMARLILSLWNDPCGFSIRECMRAFDRQREWEETQRRCRDCGLETGKAGFEQESGLRCPGSGSDNVGRLRGGQL